MKQSELRDLLNNLHERGRNREDNELRIHIHSPSMGPRATVGVKYISEGFDWENGMLIIEAEKPIVVKSEKEKVWDMAFDHIYRMSLRVSHKGNPTSEAKWAKEVLKRAKE